MPVNDQFRLVVTFREKKKVIEQKRSLTASLMFYYLKGSRGIWGAVYYTAFFMCLKYFIMIFI